METQSFSSHLKQLGPFPAPSARGGGGVRGEMGARKGERVVGAEGRMERKGKIDGADKGERRRERKKQE